MTRPFKTKLAIGFPLLGDKIKAEDYWRSQNRHDLIRMTDQIVAEFRAYHEDKTSASWPTSWKTWYVRAVRFIAAPKQFEPRGRGQQTRFFRAPKEDETHVPLSMVRELADKLRSK